MFNVLHECWCLHAYNILVHLDLDYDDLKRRIEEQVLTLTEKRSLPDHQDRILSPQVDATNFLLDKIREKYGQGFI